MNTLNGAIVFQWEDFQPPTPGRGNPHNSRSSRPSEMLTMAKLEIPAGHPSPRDTKMFLQKVESSPPPSASAPSPSSTSAPSPSSSSGGSPSPSTDHWGAAFSSMFGGGGGGSSAHGECLACGYRYGTVEQLADHQRSEHGLAEVIF